MNPALPKFEKYPKWSEEEDYAENQNGPWNREPEGRSSKRMAGRSQETSVERKEVLEIARPIESATSQAALGPNRKGVHFRRAGGQGDARRFVRWKEPAHRLPLHVRAGVAGRLRTLFFL